MRRILIILLLLCGSAQADPVSDLKGCLANLNALGDALEAHFARTGNYPASLKELGVSLPPCPAAGKDTYSAGYVGPSDPAAPDYLLACQGTHHQAVGLRENEPGYVSGDIMGNSRALFTGTDRGCVENMANLMAALELYASEHEGVYPSQLQEAMAKRPVCPVAGRDTYSAAYAVSRDPDAYTLLCQDESHQALGVSSSQGFLLEPAPEALASVEAVLAECRRRNQAADSENGYLDLVEVIGTRDRYVEEKAAPYLALGKQFFDPPLPPSPEARASFAAVLPGLRAALSKPALAWPVGAEPGWEDLTPNLVALRNLNRSLIVSARESHDLELLVLGLEMSARLSGRQTVVLDMVAASLAGDSILALLTELAARPAAEPGKMLERIKRLFPPENLLMAADIEWAFWDRAFFKIGREGKVPVSLRELFEGLPVADWEAERALLGQQYRAARPVLARCGAPAVQSELTRPANVLLAATSWPMVMRNWDRLQHRLTFLRTVLALDAYHKTSGRYPATLSGLPRPDRPARFVLQYAVNPSGYVLESRLGKLTRTATGGTFEMAPVR